MGKTSKNVLITAGGTIVKIDDVRHIGNFSSGKSLSQIAEEALMAGHKVFYLHAKKAKLPFSDYFIFNPRNPVQAQFKSLLENKKRFLTLRRNLNFYEFETVDDYSSLLKKILRTNLVDIIFLGAAVSDYGVKQQRGKISSLQERLKLTLFKYPKIIKFVKVWSKKPIFQVGFKLLSNVKEDDLIEAAYKSGIESKSDITIANDLAKIRRGRREVILITPEKGSIKMAEPRLAKKVFSFVEKRANTTHFKTITKSNPSFTRKYKGEFKIFSTICKRLYNYGLMPQFFSGSPGSHGSLSLRIDKNSFLITGRASNKKDLKPKDIVLVKSVNWEKRKILTESLRGSKPSPNAVLVASIFTNSPRVNAVVHTHNLISRIPTTSFPQTPGTLEYITEPVELLKKSRMINLKNHGLVAVGKDLLETTNYVIKKSKS